VAGYKEKGCKIAMDPILGSIILMPWKWQVEGWLKCDGTELNIRGNQALYCLLGNEFGGSGTTTFCIPKLSPIKTENGGDLDYYICIQGVFPSRS
jgi:microcystin-dependent protein